MSHVVFGEDTLDRMVRAVEKVRDRLKRATTALERHHVPYAVVGGNAVAAWVAQVDEAAVRNTPDVNIALRRDDLETAKIAMAGHGFVYEHSSGTDLFLDGPDGKVRSAVKIVFSGEPVRQDEVTLVPDVSESIRIDGRSVLLIEPLVRMMLASHRREDRMLIRDVIDVKLVNESWPARFPAELAARLQQLLDTPDG